MDFYRVKRETGTDKVIVVDDMILTKDMPTTAGSKMLDGYLSPFEAEVVTRLEGKGYEIGGKAKVGEFSIDLLGETAFDNESESTIKNAAAEIIKADEAEAAIALDVNGSVRRAAAQSGLISIKPTYGVVSRYGTIPVVCSGETVSVMAKDTAKAENVLKVIAGHDDKDGTSHSEEKCQSIFNDIQKKNKVVVLADMYDSVDDEVRAVIDDTIAELTKSGVAVEKKDSGVIGKARAAWNILMSAELCNNVSRYDGVKYGYRSSNYTNIDELYTNSRTEAFGELLKTAIIFGSETLSTENYMKVYDKAMRVRRVICEEFEKLFKEYDAVIIPVVSTMEYTKEKIDSDKYISYKENLYTAPSSITGLPTVVAGGIQLIGKAFSERVLLDYAKICKKESE